MLSTRLCINSDPDPDLPEGLLSFQNVGLLLDKNRQACLSQIRILIVCQTQLKLLQMLLRQSCPDRNAFKVQPELLPWAALRGGRLRRGCDNSEKARGNNFHNHIESLEGVCCKNLPPPALFVPSPTGGRCQANQKSLFPAPLCVNKTANFSPWTAQLIHWETQLVS